MSISVQERTSRSSEYAPENTQYSLGALALSPAAEISYNYNGSDYIPIDSLNEIQRILEAPIEEIDISLRSLTSLCRHEASQSDTHEIPRIIVNAVDATADRLRTNWELDDYTTSAVAGLTDAYAITGNHDFIDTASHALEENPGIGRIVPQLKQSVEYAIEHPEELDATFSAIDRHTEHVRLLPVNGEPKEEPPLATEQAVAQVPFTEMEKIKPLFHPTIRRPNTPEYTHAGIHKSLSSKEDIENRAKLQRAAAREARAANNS